VECALDVDILLGISSALKLPSNLQRRSYVGVTYKIVHEVLRLYVLDRKSRLPSTSVVYKYIDCPKLRFYLGIQSVHGILVADIKSLGY